MNVFEDLITELKEANLLENTVIDDHAYSSLDAEEIEVSDATERKLESGRSTTVNIESPQEYNSGAAAAPTSTEPGFLSAAEDSAQLAERPSAGETRVKKGKDFFKKRAVAEVSSLQMVEHVLTSVEREYLKVVPKTFDDFNVKKALNNFLQMADTGNADGHAEAESEMMRETETWCSALAERDKGVHASSLREYCENTKPALSSQAMLSIARFYRNLPYTELVRSKFDFVITRLFSRPSENERRACIFSRDETLNHIKTLYADWSSVPLYAADDDNSSVMLASLSFEDLAHEAENASTFDQLIKTDFFGRLRMFKESINEMFFAPIVTAAAIEANVRIGNAYVTLIARERNSFDADVIQSKYGSLNDQVVADATGRTLDLVDILKAPLEDLVQPEEETQMVQNEETADVRPNGKPETIDKPQVEKSQNTLVASLGNQVRSINRWVLVFSAVMVFGAIALAIYANYFATTDLPTAGVAAVEFDNPQITEHVQKAKVSNAILYVQLQAGWESLTKEKRQEILQKILAAGTEKGYREVNLVSKDGKMVGYASPTRLDIVMP